MAKYKYASMGAKLVPIIIPKFCWKYSNNEMDLERLSKELHGELSNDQKDNDDDPFAEGNYIARA